jgi:predicted SnoaL-like aldol condensation-catalyzing enzyme
MSEQNAAVVRRVVDSIWNRGDLHLADSLFATVYINHGGVIPDIVHGPEAIKISVTMYRAAFPRFSVTIDRLTADGDIVDFFSTARVPFDDRPPRTARTSHEDTVIGMTRNRLTSGRIVESWTSWDDEDLLRRLAQSVELRPGTGPNESCDRPDG